MQQNSSNIESGGLTVKKKVIKKKQASFKNGGELIKVKQTSNDQQSLQDPGSQSSPKIHLSSVNTPSTNLLQNSNTLLLNNLPSMLDQQRSHINSQSSQIQLQFSQFSPENSQTLRKKKPSGASFLDKYKKNLKQYNDLVLADKYFKQVYAENLKAAIFTFPKFKRNYSKNYAKVQSSFAKYSTKKKTIIFDIDETLVFAAHSATEMPTEAVDTTIRIKVNKYGGA